MHQESSDQGGGGAGGEGGSALYLRCSKVEGITLAVAECMVEAKEGALPGCMALAQQLATALGCSKGGQGGRGVAGLWVLPAH